MKRLFVFDLDHTIFSHTQKKILPNTVKLLKKISEDENNYLAFATGRGPHRMDKILDQVIDCFQFHIYINGALAYDRNKIIYDNHFDKKLALKIYNKAKKLNIPAGLISKNSEYITLVNEDVLNNIADFSQGVFKKVDKLPNDDIYQFWIFTFEKEKQKEIIDLSSNLRAYYWKTGGFDLVSKHINKVLPIKKIKELYQIDQVIAIGDGLNDIDMIEYADLGIALDNSASNLVKEKADLIAPSIDQDLLLDFFLQRKII